MRVLAIETSCDETSAAVVEATSENAPRIVTNQIHAQLAAHAPFGGVVPEVASREHLVRLMRVVRDALAPVGPDAMDAIDGIAVTRGPGLIGALLVGMQFAKGLALARNLPWIGVNHLEGHLSAILLEEFVTYPFVGLVVSGGHTHLYEVASFGGYRMLGGTRDDAAGEAFDKVAKLLGLGYPGGVQIQKLAEGGDPQWRRFPRALQSRTSFDFSFSGLKTSVAQYLARRAHPPEGDERRDLCASVQEAIADILSKKVVLAARHCRVGGIVLAGGVAANLRLRELVTQRAAEHDLWVKLPKPILCTDNAAMIGAAGLLRLAQGQRSTWEESALSRWPLGALASG